MIHMRSFTPFEEDNLAFLVNMGIKFTQVEITPTGLDKGILDSTVPMRTFFKENRIHDYESQNQGQENEVVKNAVILTECSMMKTKVSFYRPNTKKGDPRMWIYKLGSFSQGNDIHTLIWYDKTLYSINITRINIKEVFESVLITPIQELLKVMSKENSSVADELLDKFRSVSGMWFESEITADTGIGRSIETFLGISMNSDKTPDYKGIELKSHREKRVSNRDVLFTQTPDWNLSVCKSGREIVDKYGYPYNEDGKKTLQVTVKCSPPNAQELFLNVNQIADLLEMQAGKSKIEDVAVWRLMKLHDRLIVKHHETFWIEVENEIYDGKEYFRYKEIEHTKNPNVGQFDVLIERNIISLDLMLCRPSGSGDTYSFKIKKKWKPLLFPESSVYLI